MADGSEGGMLPEIFKKIILYAGAPFFGNPLKPLLNAVDGHDYARGYSHFRRDHQDPANLVCHCFCLVLQLVFNYALLYEAGKGLEALLGGGSATLEALPLATSIAWGSVLLFAQGAPFGVRVLAIACVALANMLCHFQQDFLVTYWQQIAFGTGVLWSLAFQVFVINGKKQGVVDTSGADRIPMNKLQLAVIIVVRWLLQAAVMQWANGAWANGWGTVAFNSLMPLWLIWASTNPFGGSKVQSPFLLGFTGWIWASLTSQPWVFFFGMGFLASVTQGVTHHYSGEESTLTQLTCVADELSHTTFFPNLLLHSVYQSVRYGRGPAFGDASAQTEMKEGQHQEPVAS